MKAQVDNKTAPAGAGNTNQGPIQNDTSAKEMVIVGTANPTQNGFDPKPFILKALRHAAQDHQNAREMSAECVKQGRELGLTWDQLGHALNMSPNALRMRMTRKGEAIQ